MSHDSQTQSSMLLLTRILLFFFMEMETLHHMLITIQLHTYRLSLLDVDCQTIVFKMPIPIVTQFTLNFVYLLYVI